MNAESPAPLQYLQIPDLLTAGEQQALFDFVRAHEAEFEESTVYPPDQLRGVKDVETRRSHTLFELQDIWPLFEERLQALLPHVRRELGLGWFEVEQVERQLTVHGDGDFFSRHADRAADDRRAVTFVYYFNCEPKGFTGGELRLYEQTAEVRSEDAQDFVEIQPTNNSVVFFPSLMHHEVAPVRSKLSGLEGARFTVNGWFHSAPYALQERDDGPGVRLDTSPTVIDQARLPDIQAAILPHFTEVGFELMDTPPEVQELLVEELRRRKAEISVEEADPYYQLGGNPDFLPVESGDEVLEMLRSLHERWSGVELLPAAAYGIRINRRGQSLERHCDLVGTHVISSVVHIAAETEEPWPLQIEGHDGRSHDVVLQPGQMLLYESATCPHGRTQPFAGDFHASLFLHYKPSEDWNWTYDRLARVAESRGLLVE